MNVIDLKIPSGFKSSEISREGFTLEDYLSFDELSINSPALIDTNALHPPVDSIIILNREFNSLSKSCEGSRLKNFEALSQQSLTILRDSYFQMSSINGGIQDRIVSSHNCIISEINELKSKKIDTLRRTGKHLKEKIKPWLSEEDFKKFIEFKNGLLESYENSVITLRKFDFNSTREQLELSRRLGRKIYSSIDLTYRTRKGNIKSPGRRDLALVLYGCLINTPSIISNDQDIPVVISRLKAERDKGLNIYIPKAVIPYQMFNSRGNKENLVTKYVEVEAV
ncbi:MAG: hypothetical protein ACLFPL_04400 [Candidatus Nanoarchaeia archaeon]